MPRGYVASQTCIHFMNYHFVWCPKYRRPVIVGKVKQRLGELVREKVEGLGCEVIALSMRNDHVHLFVQANPRLSPNTIIGQVKGVHRKDPQGGVPEATESIADPLDEELLRLDPRSRVR